MFTYDTPRLDINFAIDAGFDLEQLIGIDLPIEASLSFRGDLDMKAHFGFGFDTSGLQSFKNSNFTNPSAVFEGFYASDRYHSNGTGSDVSELYVNGSIKVGGSVNVEPLRVDCRGYFIHRQ